MSSLGSGRVSGSLRGRFFIFSGVTNTINTLSQCICVHVPTLHKTHKTYKQTHKLLLCHNTINSLSQCICALTLHKKASEHTSQKDVWKSSHWRWKFTNRGCFQLARPVLLQMFEEAKPTQVYVWIWEKVASALYWALPKLNTISMIRRSLREKMTWNRFFSEGQIEKYLTILHKPPKFRSDWAYTILYAHISNKLKFPYNWSSRKHQTYSRYVTIPVVSTVLLAR